jgi:hypothetical protein
MSNEDFSCWLQKKYLEWAASQIQPGKMVQSQTDFGRWLGFKQSTFSTWMTGSKVPSGNFVDLLADKLGLEVYDALGLARKMPSDKYLIYFCENWYRLTEEEKLDIYEIVKRKIEEKQSS